MAANESQALSQDDIDSLLAEMSGGAPAPSAPAAAVVAAVAASASADAAAAQPPVTGVSKARPSATGIIAKGGPLSQDDIDALVAATAEQAASPKPPTVTVRPPTAAQAAPPVTGRAGVPPGAVPTTRRATKRADKPGTDIERLLSSVENSAQSKAKSSMDAMPGLQPGVPLDQDDIDKLLAELGASAATTPPPMAAAGPGTAAGTKGAVKTGTKVGTKPVTKSQSAAGAPPAAAQPTLALSSEDLDALMNKHAAGGDTEAGMAMIDQTDIDALVKQLATATGDPDQEKISDALAKHGDEIDKLLEKATDDRVTMDAVEDSKDITVKTAPASTVAMPVMHTGPVVAHLPPSAFRGTRALLAAAVLLLAMCATTLAMVVGAVRGLSNELKQERTAQLVPSDDYHDDFSAASAKLASPDEAEAAKGVIFLERLQKRHPEHERDIALVLARHHRGAGAVARAARDYAQVFDGAAGPCDDPRIYLEYAGCLFQQQEEAAATRQVYTLLANEAFYRADRDRRGLERSADEQSRNRQAIQDAYLILGRMLASTWQQGGAIAHVRTGHEPVAGSAEAASHGASASAAHGSAPAVATPASHGSVPANGHGAPATGVSAPAATPTHGVPTAGHVAPKADAPAAPAAHGKGH